MHLHSRRAYQVVVPCCPVVATAAPSDEVLYVPEDTAKVRVRGAMTASEVAVVELIRRRAQERDAVLVLGVALTA